MSRVYVGEPFEEFPDVTLQIGHAFHLYDAELGPIESDEQPDPSVLRPVGKVVVRKRSGDTTWDIFSEPSDRPFKPKRVWARRSRE